MKTTLILPDDLMTKVKSNAKKNQISMASFIESALIEYLNKTKLHKKKIVIKPYVGNGLVSNKLQSNWSAISDILYENE